MDNHLLLLAVPFDEVSKVAGNPLVYNNAEEIYRWLDIISSQDPKVKDVRVDIVAFFDRYSLNNHSFVIGHKNPVSLRISDDRSPESIATKNREIYGC